VTLRNVQGTEGGITLSCKELNCIQVTWDKAVVTAVVNFQLP